MSKFTGLPTLYKRTSGGKVQEWTIAVEKTKSGTGIMVTTHGLTDGKKQTLREEIREGKNVGRRNETSPYEQAVLEATARWNKQKDRKGYGTDPAGEESHAIRSSSPMLAKVFEKEAKKVQWDTAFAQPKLDGFRLLARRDTKGKLVLLSRENQPMTALTHLKEILDEVLPSNGFIDGEAYCHGMSLNQISSACKKKSSLSEKIRYHVYDAVMPDADFATRSLFVKDLIEATGSEFLVGVETVKVRAESELMVCQQRFIEQGFEGAMLRHGKVGYEAGKRSSHLLKVKTFQDDEFEIVDYKMGRGKYEGMPVFVCKTADGHDFDVLAPGNLEEKRALGEKAPQLVGKRLTVKYQYYTKTDEPVPFLPVALRVRE